MDAEITLNGKPTKIQADARRMLLEILREDLHLTGTKYGCGESACGACTVLVDGKATFSCTTSLADVAGKSITTIEGIATGDQLHPVQQAFMEQAAFQCGYCTPGMILSTIELLNDKQNPTQAEIRTHLKPHICRCCTYPRILAAVENAIKATTKSSKAT
ncbi:MAG TPA: (2Fe-2S)-binding protein [Tepidisphaeraceae bacterium]|jgi:aerobic-type carbon monoxide dehydrogenase small subunit (CoxS/CutS family)|nr:(2Fe-2S)-binding protein [Tepidisphaeraceae bacterium]